MPADVAFSYLWSHTRLQYPPLWARLLMQKSMFSAGFSLLLLAEPGGPKILAWTILRQDVCRSVLMGMVASATVPLLTILRTLGPGPGGPQLRKQPAHTFINTHISLVVYIDPCIDRCMKGFS